MSRSTILALLLCFLMSSLPGCSSNDLPSFTHVQPSFHTLSNGMRVFVLEDHSLPTFRLSMIHPPGSVFEKPGERGVAGITAELLRTGGTRGHNPAQVDQLISAATAKIEFGASRASASASLRVLAEDRREMLNLMSALLREPRFDTSAFEVARRQAQVALRRSKEKPSGIAALYFPGLIYGKESPWAAVPTKEGIAALKIEQVKQFYEQQYFPARMILAVAGDFKTDAILQELEASLGQWKKTAPGRLEWPEIVPEPVQTLFIPKTASQVALRLGHLGKKRTDPDKFTLLVANFILGGSGAMTSRLGSEIRSNQGQAYSVWSQYGFKRVPGIFSMIAQTEASQEADVAQSMQRILKELQEKGVTADEVDNAKKAIIRSLLFEYESKYSIAQDWARFEFWGYQRNYLKHFAEKISKVEVDDVNRVLREDFHPDKLSVLIVGSEKLWPAIKARHPEAGKRNP